MTEFDQLAEHYDETRGGERRGDSYAASINAHLPPGDGPVLEIGVGTGVVALGLRRLGREVVGLDLSSPMLRRARSRLGDVLIRCDAMQRALASASVGHAVSVWVVHSVRQPAMLFEEAFRVIRPGGLYVVCATQTPAPDDQVGRVIAEMTAQVDIRRHASRPRGVTTAEVLEWAASAGFTGVVHQTERRWYSTPAEELAAIEHRTWPAMRELDEAAIEEVTRPVIEVLESMPETLNLRRATADLIVLGRG
jgi:ubiquinone/menaquinone biosynthesis C-methylase UbiE